MNTTDSFGYWVRRQRKGLDLTQEQLARRVGCAVVTLRKIEADTRRPSPEMAERLACCLGLPEADLAEFVAMAAGERPATRLPLPARDSLRPGSSIPSPVASLIGRDAELAEITSRLHDQGARLLTLTGPVGVGKTRLAIAAGRQLLPAFRHGVFFVGLAGVRDADMVEAATAAVLGVREARGQNLAQAVIAFLAVREMLLVFDNFEHLLPAGPFLSALLAGCPQLRLLVTSRACLHLYGEHEFVVAPLPVPAPGDLLAAADSPAVRLFCERAQAARAGFQLTPSLTPAVAEICRRLDGLPLAIELAAARVRIFSPSELLQRMERRLPFLTQGPADLSPRRQGLAEAIAWSYGLLSPLQRRRLARLAVFEGGFSLAAAEAVCATLDGQPALAAGETAAPAGAALGVAALLDQSLLAPQGTADAERAGNCCSNCPTRRLRAMIAAEPRFTMLGVVREFAQNQPESAAERHEAHQRHADYFAARVSEATAHLQSHDQSIWLERLECDAGNIRAALGRLLEAGRLETAARMACDLGTVWQRHGRYSEGRGWLEQVLAQSAHNPLSDSLRARTLQTAGMLAGRQGNWREARQELAESLALYRSAGDWAGMARAYCELGWIALDRAEWQGAVRLNRESLTLARQAGEEGDPTCLETVYQALTNQGWARLCLGDREKAAEFFEEACATARRLGHTRGVAASLVNLAWTALYAGRTDEAAQLVRVALRLSLLLGERELMAEGLEILAATEVAWGDDRRAARLSGAVEAIWEALHAPRPPARLDSVIHSRTVNAVRGQLAAPDFAAAWGQGRAMSVDVATCFALRCREGAAP